MVLPSNQKQSGSVGTELLYLEDSYLKEAKAKVVEADEEDNAVVLDQTIFYPESGGQPFDTGTIEFDGESSKVVKVIKYPGAIVHFIEGKLPETGSEVTLKIDWERRHKHMRMHSAQHLYSAIVLDKTQASTKMAIFTTERGKCEFKPVKAQDFEKLKELVSEANAAIEKKVPIKCYYVNREEALQKIDKARRLIFEKVPKDVNKIRVVEIEGIDKVPCAGTHLANCSEIGKFEILKIKDRGSEVARIEFKVI